MSDETDWELRREYQKDGKVYNERGMPICGHKTASGLCRNPPTCRFHSDAPQQLKKFYAGHLAKQKGLWSNEEHERFLQAMELAGIGRWSDIARIVGSRTAGQCQIHYYKMKQRLSITDEEFQGNIEFYGSQVYTPATDRFRKRVEREDDSFESRPCASVMEKPTLPNIQTESTWADDESPFAFVAFDDLASLSGTESGPE